MSELLLFSDRFDEFIYCVEDGERLIDISFRFGVPVGNIIRDNKLTQEVAAGRKLYIKRCPAIVITPDNYRRGAEFLPFDVVEE